MTPRLLLRLLLGAGSCAVRSAPTPPPPSGPAGPWTARWHGAVGEPFETPWSTRLLWRQQGCPESCHVDWNDGSTMIPRGPLLGNGDLGMTVISEQLPPCSPAPCAPTPTPNSPGSGNISLRLGSNQLWAMTDKDWSECHYDAATCTAHGQPTSLTNWSGNGANHDGMGCYAGWLPGCRAMFPRRVGLGGLNISAAAFTGPSSRFVAELDMQRAVVSAGYVRGAHGRKQTFSLGSAFYTAAPLRSSRRRVADGHLRDGRRDQCDADGHRVQRLVFLGRQHRGAGRAVYI